MAGSFARMKRQYDAEHPREQKHTVRRWVRQWRCFWTWPLGHRWTGYPATCVVCGRVWIGNI